MTGGKKRENSKDDEGLGAFMSLAVLSIKKADK
jgi:hypothetical protein